MKTIDLHKELIQLKEKRTSTFEPFTSIDPVDEVNTMLSRDRALSLLKQISPNAKNVKAKKLKEKYKDLEVYSKEDIMKMCTRYALVLAHSRKYEQEIPIEAGIKLNEIIPKTERYNKYYDPGNIYILAPKSHFDRSVAERTKLNRDPIMFIHENNEFIFVHKWGNDFTIFRRILGELTYNDFYKITFFSVLIAFIGYTICKSGGCYFNIIGYLTLSILSMCLSIIPTAALSKDSDNLIQY
jgi:hypothetical protein